jgi:inosose dehydratase
MSINLRLGSAPDSWGVWFPDDPKQTPPQRFLDEVAEAGYEWIELGPYGYLPTDPKVLSRELKLRGLKISGIFALGDLADPAAWPEIEKQIIGGGDLAAPLGARFLILIDNIYTDLFTGKPLGPNRLDEDGWKRLIDSTHRIAEMGRERYDMQLVFHPHAETHVEYEDQVEALLDQTDEDLVKLCLETGHQAYRGGDPVAMFRKYGKQRIPYLHLKNVDPNLIKKVAKENIPFAKAVEIDLFCEPNRGVVNFLDLRDALDEQDFDGWAIVEQDMYPCPFDKPLLIAKRTRAYLKEIGIG